MGVWVWSGMGLGWERCGGGRMGVAGAGVGVEAVWGWANREGKSLGEANKARRREKKGKKPIIAKICK